MKKLKGLITKALMALTALVATPVLAGHGGQRGYVIPSISSSNVSVNEAAGTATVTLQKTGHTKASSAINYITHDGSAIGGRDYTPKVGSITMAASQSSATITVPILQDTTVEGNETFTVTFASVNNATITTPLITVTIVDDDTTVPDTSPIAPLTPVADNFTTADGIAANNWSPAIAGPSPDDTGNFRMICGAGQLKYDDPVVFPGQPGASHLHQFYGNLLADANSTYTTLRTTGGSTCGDPNASIAVNRSGYWMPAMLDGVGHVVKPEYVAIYYKREPAGSPACTPGNAAFVGICVGIPTGLRFITGYTMTGGTTDAHPFYYCQDSDLGGATGVSSTLHDKMNAAIPDCPVSSRLTLNIGGPDCWDGVHLDSVDHRSHMAQGAYVWNGTTSIYRCDSSHPYHIPKMTLIAFYIVDANFTAGRWSLSCDAMAGTAAGDCFHADYFEAWSPTVRATWDLHCTDDHEQCAGGDLGDGTHIKGMTTPNTSGLVAIPAH